MTQHFPEIEGGSFLQQLNAAHTAHRDHPALVYKWRGAWVALSWTEVLGEVETLALGLRSLGVGPGRIVGIDGELQGRFLLSAAAVKAVGASLLPLPLSASGAELRSLMSSGDVVAVIAQKRERVAEYSRVLRHGRSIPIIFDHVTPDARSPGAEILTFEQLRALDRLVGRTLRSDGLAPQVSHRSFGWKKALSGERASKPF